jgi:hypothetical protein
MAIAQGFAGRRLPVGSKRMVDLSQAKPTALAQILAFPDEEAPWGAGDLGGLLRHQLRSPWLIRVPDDSASSVGDVNQPTGDVPITCLGDLLLHESPSPSILRLAKEHAKQMARQVDGELPADIGRVLYYTVLAAAIVAGDRTITTLSNDELRQGLTWATAQPWLDERLHALLIAADARLSQDAW